MGKGDKKSKRGKITAGSYGKRRPKRKTSAANIPVAVLNEDSEKSAKVKVRDEVGFPDGASQNAETKKKPTAKSKTEE